MSKKYIAGPYIMACDSCVIVHSDPSSCMTCPFREVLNKNVEAKPNGVEAPQMVKMRIDRAAEKFRVIERSQIAIMCGHDPVLIEASVVYANSKQVQVRNK